MACHLLFDEWAQSLCLGASVATAANKIGRIENTAFKSLRFRSREMNYRRARLAPTAGDVDCAALY